MGIRFVQVISIHLVEGQPLEHLSDLDMGFQPGDDSLPDLRGYPSIKNLELFPTRSSIIAGKDVSGQSLR